MYSSTLPIRFIARRNQGFVSFGFILIGVSIYFLCDALTLSDPLEFAVFVPSVIFGFVLLVGRKSYLVIAAIAVTVACYGYWMVVRHVDAEKLRPIAKAAADLVEERRTGNGQFSVPGKVLVWDVSTNSPSSVQYRLPAPLRARPGDTAMTIFLVWDKQSKKVYDYHVVGGSMDTVAEGFRDGSNVAVVDWPGRRMLGWRAMMGEAPPTRLQVQTSSLHNPIHGDWNGPMVAWIRTLQTATSPRTWGDTSAGLAALYPASTSAPAGFMAPAASSATPATHTWTEAEARAEAIRRYPQISVANSVMNRAFVQKYQEMKASNPAVLRDPMWPLRLAEEVAR